MAVGRWDAVALDCAEPRELAAFWAELIGGQVWISTEDLAAVEAEGKQIITMRVAGYRPPSWPDESVPKQIHLDLSVEDLDAAEAAALALGARKPTEQPEPERWRVLLDPAGHPFCISAPPRGRGTGSRALTWEVKPSHGHETAWIEELGDGVLRARGRAMATTPAPYWVEYWLDTGPQDGVGYVTRQLRVTIEPADGGARRKLHLRRDGEGHWTANGEPLPELDGALDCDLGLCPLTNTMPVLRHSLHRGVSGAFEEEHGFLMAWVGVPDLTVQPSRQTYTRLSSTPDGGARIRYASGTFRSHLTFDADGFVTAYPGLARRLTGGQA